MKQRAAQPYYLSIVSTQYKRTGQANITMWWCSWRDMMGVIRKISLIMSSSLSHEKSAKSFFESHAPHPNPLCFGTCTHWPTPSAYRQYNEFCAWLPLRRHISRPDWSARPGPRCDPQCIPRTLLHRRALRRLLPLHLHPCVTWHQYWHRHLCHRGPTVPPTGPGKCAATALTGRCTHWGRVGLGLCARTDTLRSRWILMFRCCTATWCHGSLSVLGRECRTEYCTLCKGVLDEYQCVCFFHSPSPLIFS